MEPIRLRNGNDEAAPLVAATMMTLRHLIDADVIAFYELTMLCRDPKHAVFGNVGAKLIAAGLLDERGVPHQSVRNVVLSAVKGEGLGLTLMATS